MYKSTQAESPEPARLWFAPSASVAVANVPFSRRGLTATPTLRDAPGPSLGVVLGKGWLKHAGAPLSTLPLATFQSASILPPAMYCSDGWSQKTTGCVSAKCAQPIAMVGADHRKPSGLTRTADPETALMRSLAGTPGLSSRNTATIIPSPPTLLAVLPLTSNNPSSGLCQGPTGVGDRATWDL